MAQFIELWGGLGDVLLLTPSLRVLAKANNRGAIIVYSRSKSQKEILKYNPNVSLHLRSKLMYWIIGGKQKFIRTNYGHYKPSVTGPEKHAVEHIAGMLDITLDNHSLDVYFHDKEIRKAKDFIGNIANPVMINPSAECSRLHEWDKKRWEFIVDAFPTYTFMQVGLLKEPYINGTVDLRGKLPLRIAMALMLFCRAFVGVDSFWGHLASAARVPAVVLFGDSTPDIWGHNNNVNIYKRVNCSPCIDIFHGVYCPNGHQCMNSISVDEVLDALRTILKEPAKYQV